METDNFNNLKNDLIHYWIQFQDASPKETIVFLIKEQFVQATSSSLEEFIRNEHADFKQRGLKTPDWIDKLPRYNYAIGSNPFMTGEYDGWLK